MMKDILPQSISYLVHFPYNFMDITIQSKICMVTLLIQECQDIDRLETYKTDLKSFTNKLTPPN